MNANRTINTICIDAAGNLYVGGNFYYSMGSINNYTNYVAKWDGNTWSIIGQNSLFASSGIGQIGYSGFDDMLVNSTGTLYVVGEFSTKIGYYVGKYP